MIDECKESRLNNEAQPKIEGRFADEFIGLGEFTMVIIFVSRRVTSRRERMIRVLGAARTTGIRAFRRRSLH